MTTEAALSYLARGWSVVPGHGVLEGGLCTCRQKDCDRPGKHPRVKWSEFRERRATEAELRRWFGRWKDASVIVITGKISGLVVLDVDPRHGGDETLADWERTHGELPETPRSLTGGGGTHYLFAHPMDEEVETTVEFLPGLDTRADGNGYIMVPPSSHASGRAYEWDSAAHPDDLPLAPWPKALSDTVKHRYRGGLAGEKHTVDVDGIIAGTVKVPDGSRNEILARVAGYMIYAEDARSADAVMSMVMGVVEKSFEPPLEEREVRRTVESIIRRDQRRREAEARAERTLADTKATIEAEELDAEDRIETAASLWAEAGVAAVSDWYVMMDGQSVEYILMTPEDEIRLGSDLLDYLGIRRTLLNRTSLLLPDAKKPGTWDRRMYLLRQLAREEVLESARASEQVDEWVDDYLRANTPQVDPEPEMRREWISTSPIIVDGRLWLRPQRLARFIEATYGEKLEPRQLTRLLKRAGWESGHLADGRGSSLRAWSKAQ